MDDAEITNSTNAVSSDEGGKKRFIRSFPSTPFEDCLDFAKAIFRYAPAGKIRRLTIFEKLEKSPTSSASQIIITNCNKYGLIKGNYKAEHLELTSDGLTAVDEANYRNAISAQFRLAVEKVPPFAQLYTEYREKRLAARDVLRDSLEEKGIPKALSAECADLFITNVKYLGLSKPIAGTETLISLEQLLDELPAPPRGIPLDGGLGTAIHLTNEGLPAATSSDRVNWDETCFYITAIGDEGTEKRKHSDLFLGNIVEPALRHLGLRVIRADQIGAAGMITAQVIEHVLFSRLVVVDMSFHNPNVFYEMCLRHVTRKPIIQICRKADPLPFDVGQARTIVIDTSDIYSLVPQLEVHRSEIATFARSLLSTDEAASNPLTTFFPKLELKLN